MLQFETVATRGAYFPLTRSPCAERCSPQTQPHAFRWWSRRVHWPSHGVRGRCAEKSNQEPQDRAIVSCDVSALNLPSLALSITIWKSNARRSIPRLLSGRNAFLIRQTAVSPSSRSPASWTTPRCR